MEIGGNKSGVATEPIMMASEAQRLVEALKTIPVDEIGTSDWIRQHEALEKLNLQSHYNAMANADEFVMEAAITHDKLPVLVHELLAIEAWTDKVLPLIRDDVAAKHNIRAYFAMYHEATVANLFEVFMYYDYACEAMGDALVDLTDFCVRKLRYLAARQYQTPAGDTERKGEEDDDDDDDDSKPKSAADVLKSETPSQALLRQQADIRFGVGMVALTMLRYLTEHMSKLPLAVMSRLLDTHDVLQLLVPLIENPPWTRRTEDGKWQKFINQKWADVAPADLLKLTQIEGQAWLAMYNLTCNPDARARYHVTPHRKSNVLRVRKYLNELLLDQLPVLADVQRYLDEMTIVEPPPPSGTAGGLVLEQVPAIRDAILRSGGDWKAVARKMKTSVFAGDDAKDPDLKRLAGVFSLDAYDQFLGEAKCYECGAPATKRCSRCKNAWYCGRECQVKAWKAHKVLCDVVVAAPAGGGGGGGGGGKTKVAVEEVETKSAGGGGGATPVSNVTTKIEELD